jgi:translation initiation factor IF-2
MRVHELADELDMESSELIEYLEEELGEEVGNHMSGLDDEVVDLVLESYHEDGESSDESKEATEQAETETADEAEEIEETDEASPQEPSDEPAGDTTETMEAPASDEDTIVVRGTITTEELAEKIGIEPNEAIKTLMGMDVMATINQTLQEEEVELLADEYGFEVAFEEAEEEEISFKKGVELDLDVPEGELEERPPVVTIMGHVDHGKTQLLDTIRETDVLSDESGGITQHIGAWKVHTEDGEEIVFIDTPGHEAFTAMRARGADVTDLVILVVAADQGVQPQTVESINHAREAGVPMVVAINKMDLPEADADRVRQQLSEHELIPEEWGGDTIMVELSALEGNNVDELLEMIDIQSELMELKASPVQPVKGTVIESELKKGMGAVATVLVQQGTLEKGDPFLAGTTYGSVRALIDSYGDRVDSVGPGEPVQVLGFDDVPEPGDVFEVAESESDARDIAEDRADEMKEAQQSDSRRVTLDQLQEFLDEGKVKTLNIIVKADAQGSVEVLKDSFESIEGEDVEARVVHTGVGGINESDVMLAEAAEGMIIGFNVRPDSRARDLAQQKQIEIKTYNVIYEAIQDVKDGLEGLLEPDVEEAVMGHAEVREVFSIPDVGNIAGVYVTDGHVERNAMARIVRDGVIVFDGNISSLKRFQEDVTEVDEGYECGIGLEDFDDIKEGDVIELYQEKEVQATLS